MADVAEVKDEFDKLGYPLDSKVIADEAFALCRQFNLDAFDLALHWDGFSVEQASKKDKKALMPDASNIEAFKLHVERKVAERRKSTSMRTPKSLVYGRPNLMESLEKNPRALEESGAFASITPGRGGTTPGAKTSAAKAAYAGTAPSGVGPLVVALPEVDARGALEAHAAAPGASAYAKRAGSRSVKTELGANLPTLAQAPDTRRPPVAVRVIDAVTNLPALATDVRFMRDRIGDKVDMLESRIGDFRRETERVTGADASRAVYAASQDDVTVVGRVVCDSEGRLNEASVQLEGDMANSAGMRVRLELRDVPSFSLFPGQIVRVTGANPSGHCLVAKSIVAHAPPPMCASPASSPAFGAQSVVIASGPFTCSSDLSFEPFADLLRYCEERRPDSVVLCGPFVDCDHRVVRGDAGVDVSFEKVFEVGVRDRLADFASRCEAGGYAPNVVLVPSVRDAVADPVFPSPLSRSIRWVSMTCSKRNVRTGKRAPGWTSSRRPTRARLRSTASAWRCARTTSSGTSPPRRLRARTSRRGRARRAIAWRGSRRTSPGSAARIRCSPPRTARVSTRPSRRTSRWRRPRTCSCCRPTCSRSRRCANARAFAATGAASATTGATTRGSWRSTRGGWRRVTSAARSRTCT